MRSEKVILEEIDVAEAEYNTLRYRAKAIYEQAKAENRGFTYSESREFDNITDESVGLIIKPKTQLESLRAEQAQIQEQKRQLVMSRNPSGMVYNNTYSGDTVLPTNGILPGDRVHQSFPQVRSQRLRAFNSERDAYAAGTYLKAIDARLSGRGHDADAEDALRKFGMEITNASYEGSGPAGGYLVPPQISQTIIDTRERVGIARQVCQIYQMTGDSISIPKRSGGLTVYYPNELQTITDSDKGWSQIAGVARKRAVAAKISQELMDDALISIADNIFTEMSYALALQEDNELCSGTGASTYGTVTGLRSAIGTAGVYTCDANENLWSEIDLEDVIGTMAKLPDRFNRNPVWICSSNFYWAVFARLLAAGAGNRMADIASGPERSFLGTPVLTTSVMPTADEDSTIHALFGQFDMAVILADRTGIRIGRDDSTGFLADYTTLKATSRYDIQVHEPGDSSNAGAYVALKTNAA